MRAVLDKNILVISDLHLGEDLRPSGANLSYLRHLVRLERELEDFLRHHTVERLAGRPWRLVVNGDMVDFMSMMVLPDGEAADERTNAEDQLYGLGFGERQSQKKLEKVIVRHRGVFSRLAEFVQAGNDLVIILGNHDVEFHYQRVQRTLVEWLCGLALGAGAGEEAKAEFAARIQFCPWFYYQKDLIYIEHGHQYDEYCSFDYVLHPVTHAKPGAEPGIALSVAHAGMRYFANQLPEYDPHLAEQWSFINYVRWAWAQGVRGMIQLCYFYGLLIWRLAQLWYLLIDHEVDGQRHARHAERLRALSSEWQIAEEKLLALDGLRRAPVTKRFWKLLSALFIDRMLLGVVTLGAAAALAARVHGLWRLGAPFGLLVAGAVVNELLSRLRLETSASKLRAATHRIQQLVCAPFIVFGHSHSPEQSSLAGGAVYFNTGSWASDDAKHAFTHLVVTAAGGEAKPSAELRQWRDGLSAPYSI